MDFVANIFIESFVLLARMAPYLILGFAVAGALHVLLPEGLISRHLGKPGAGSVIRATAVGVPLPLCSCGVVPVAASLKKSGASDGAVVGFLVSTPTSGVDSILATYSLIGGAYAVIRVIGSFVLGIGAGLAVGIGLKPAPTPTPTPTPALAVVTEAPAESCANSAAGASGNRLMIGLRYGFGEMVGAIARPMAFGILLGGLITVLMPAGVLEKYIGVGIVSYLVMLAVGLPLYVCASGSIPLAAALMAKGISPGAALVFLIVGPATNAATFTVVLEMLGKRVLVIYLSVIAGGALVLGFATDAFFHTWPGFLPDIVKAGAHHANRLSLFEIATGAALGALTAYHLGKQLHQVFKRFKKPDQDAFVLQVPDMSCQHCAGTIRGALRDLPGVRRIDADPGTKRLTLGLDEDADSDAIIKAIQDAGFHPEP